MDKRQNDASQASSCSEYLLFFLGNRLVEHFLGILNPYYRRLQQLCNLFKGNFEKTAFLLSVWGQSWVYACALWWGLQVDHNIDRYDLITVASFTVNVCATLKTMWSIMASPLMPGYFPAVFSEDRSNRLAPVSWQMAWTNIFFPTPAGPASRMDFTRGAFSCTTWEPEDNTQLIFIWRYQCKNNIYCRVL